MGEQYDTKMAMQRFKSIEESNSERRKRSISKKISHSFHAARLSTEDMEEYDYCMKVMNVCIDWKNMNGPKGHQSINRLLCEDRKKYEWIQLNVFLTLFPNLKEINVRNVKLSKLTIE